MSATPKTEPFTDVCVDLDEVLYPFAAAFRQYCETVHYRRPLEEPLIYDFYKQWGMTSAEFVKILPVAAETHNVYSTQIPMEGSVEGWKLLRAAGVQIHIITARPDSARKQTTAWLEAHGLVPDGLHFAQNKTIVMRIAVGRCAAIDDHIPHFDQLTEAGVHTLMRSHTWNAEHPTEMRVNSFKEFAQFVFDTNQTATAEQSAV